MKSAKAVILVVFLVAVPSFAASDIFAKLGDIKGESTDAGHKDWIEISSFSWGMSASPAVQHAGLQGCATNEVRLAIVKLTPQLLQKCQPNEHIPEVVIDLHGERHVLQGATVRSCQNNMMVLHFDRCATHPAPLAASMVNLNSGQPNGQIVFANIAESLNLLGLRQTGPNTISVVHRGASSRLMQACATGQHFKEMKLTCRKAGKGQQEFYTITLKDVLITSVQRNADGSTTHGLRYGSMQGSLAGMDSLQ